MVGLSVRVAIGLVCFGVIETVDHFVSGFSSPWIVSLIIGILVGFGFIEALDELGSEV